MSISITGLTKRYGSAAALESLSLAMGPGVCGLLGPNGAGKSTLLAVLAGALIPDEGRVEVAGIDVRQAPHQVRARVGYLPQAPQFIHSITPQEHLMMVAAIRGVAEPWRYSAVADLLEEVGLAGYRRTPAGRLSAGLQRRLGLAHAMVGEPPVLLLDEPTANLDPEGLDLFPALLAKWGRNRTVVVATHAVSDVVPACGQVAVLSKGRLRFAGTPAALAGQARQGVWELRVPAADYPAVAKQVQVLSTRRIEEVLLRVVAPENPLGQGRPVEPGPLEGYLALMEEGESS